MRIVKRVEAGNLVVFSGPILELRGQVVRGFGWSYTAPNDWVLVLEEAELPEGFVNGGWTYTNGTWAINAAGRAGVFPGKRKVQSLVMFQAAKEANYAPITYNGVDWPTDEVTRDALAQILSIGRVPNGMYWRDINGAKQAVTYLDLQNIAFAIVERALAIDIKLDSKKAEIATANNIAAINAVTW